MQKKTNVLTNKKGNVLDWFLIIPILMMIAITIFVSFIIINIASQQTIFTEVEAAKDAINYSKNTILNFDNMMLFVIIGLSMFVLISSAMVYNHPAFFIISFFLLCIAVMVAAVVSNSFWVFSNQSSIVSTSAHFPKIKFLMDKLPFYVCFMGIAASITAYVAYMKE